MTHRINCIAKREAMFEWEIDNCTSFDCAGKGSSALVTALFRSLVARVAHYNNEHSIGVFNDFLPAFRYHFHSPINREDFV